MALVFYNTPEAPVECALEISRAIKDTPNSSYGWALTAARLVV